MTCRHRTGKGRVHPEEDLLLFNARPGRTLTVGGHSFEGEQVVEVLGNCVFAGLLPSDKQRLPKSIAWTSAPLWQDPVGAVVVTTPVLELSLHFELCVASLGHGQVVPHVDDQVRLADRVGAGCQNDLRLGDQIPEDAVGPAGLNREDGGSVSSFQLAGLSVLGHEEGLVHTHLCPTASILLRVDHKAPGNLVGFEVLEGRGSSLQVAGACLQLESDHTLGG